MGTGYLVTILLDPTGHSSMLQFSPCAGDVAHDVDGALVIDDVPQLWRWSMSDTNQRRDMSQCTHPITRQDYELVLIC